MATTSVELIPFSDPSSETHNKAPQKCTHFSIRGYVSEVRKSDPTLCNPFPLKNTLKAFCYELPPMEVPMFRWWQCVSCVSGEHALGQSSKLNVEYHRLPNGDPKGKGKALVQDEPAGPTAWGSGFDKDSRQGLLLLTTGNNEECSTAAKKETELRVRCNGNGIIEAHRDSRANGLEAGPTQEYANHNGADSPMNVVEMEVDELATTRNKIRLVNLPDLNECSGVPLFDETNEPMITYNSNNDVFCEDDDDCLGAECRKFPKFRLLSEIPAKGRKKHHSVTNSESTTESDDISEEIISTAMTKRRCKARFPFIERKNKRSKLDHASSSEGRGEAKGENLLRKNDVTDRLIERSFVMTKKRGKQAMSFAPCKTQVLKDENAEKCSSQKVQKASEDGIKCSRSFIIKRKCQPYVLEVGFCLPSSEAEPMLIDGSRPEKQNDVRETSTAGNFENLVAEKSSPLAQDTSLQVLDSVSKQKEQTNKVQGRMHDIDINSIPTDDKVEDDIPMDIVELMAKNQYERHLDDLNEKHDYPAAPGNSEKSKSHNGVDGNLSHFSDFNHRPPCIPSFCRTENPIAARLVYPMQGQEYNSPNAPPSGSSLNNWNVSYSMEKPQFVPPLESYRIQPCTPRLNTTEGPQVYPSVVASRMHQGSSSILAFNAPCPVSLGKQQNLDFTNGYNIRAHSKSSAGSVDGYSKDANSTMHLLSMMQSGAQMHNVADLSLAPLRQGMGQSSSKQPFIENNSQSSTIKETTHRSCYPTAIPIDRSFPWSFRNDAGKHGKSSSNTGFVSPIPLTIRGQRNIESHQSRQVRFVEDAAPSIVVPGRVRRDERIFSPNPEKLICKLNQNPSEFNDLKQMSRYMIRPQDLRPRGTIREKLSRARGYSKKQDIKRFNKHKRPSKEREQQSKL